MHGKIRQASRPDITHMHRIRMSVTENRLVSMTLSEADYVDAIERTGRGWVMQVGDEIVAFAVGNSANASIWALFVDPVHEGKGYGRQLHDVMVKWLWDAGCERLWLTTDPHTRAAKFYTAAGWRLVGAAKYGEARFELEGPGRRDSI